MVNRLNLMSIVKSQCGESHTIAPGPLVCNAVEVTYQQTPRNGI